MASTLTNLLVHIVFSTKNHEALIPEEVERDLYAYVGGICRRLGSPLLDMGGTVDHVHLLVSLAKTLALSELMLNIKRDSSSWMSERAPGFNWQGGYFAFSVGVQGVPALREYIAGQKEHHKSVDFKGEMRMFFRKYGIEWNDEYVWA